MTFVVDTHTLVWYLAGSTRLGLKAKAVLDDPQSQLAVPAIALAEACWITARGRVPRTVDELLETVQGDPRVVILPLDYQAVARSMQLGTINEMHDRQIVAAALLLAERGIEVRLLTRDDNIRSSQLIPTVWD